MIKWVKTRISHKLDNFSKEKLKAFIKKNGLAFVVIFVGWEIVEDVVFPLMFLWLGNNVHPTFHTGIIASLVMCFHPVAVPVLWAIWVKISRRKNESKDIEDKVCGPTCS